ncbi:MAG: hypothetical protein ACE5KM_24765 [Planctomycetaceae bacterium]
MQQIKLFKSVESEIASLQREINAWLEQLQQGGGTVVQIAGNISPQTVAAPKSSITGGFSASDLFILVLYEQT